MNGWVRNGPVVVEVDGTAEGLRVIDYACVEALRSGAELVADWANEFPQVRVTRFLSSRLLERRRLDDVTTTY